MKTDLLTVKEVAALLRVGLTTAYALLKAGEIPSVKIGRQYRVRSDAVQKYIES